MSASTRAELIRFGFVAAVIGILLATPLLGIEASATITEDLFVSDPANRVVYVLRTRWVGTKAATTSLRGVVTGFKNPTDVAVAGDIALVVDKKDVRFVDTQTLKIVGKVKTGKSTRSVAITPDGQRAFAAQGKKNLRVIDVSSRKVIKKVRVGRTPWRVRVDDRGKFGIVMNVGDNSVSVLDIGKIVARLGGRDEGARAPGVTTTKQGVCTLSGGVDIARFPPFGSFAEWSCGDSPLDRGVAGAVAAKQAAPAQTLLLDGPGIFVADIFIPDTATTNSIFYNPACPGVGRASTEGGSDDGSSGDEEDTETDTSRIGRAQATRAFNYNFITGKKKILGPGRMVAPFAVVNANRMTLYHPQGVDVGKSSAIVGPAGADVYTVASTFGGIPSVCAR